MALSTKQLEAFLALEEVLSFTVAAERCHVSTSAFSQIISRLEVELGAKLFDRSPKQVELTPEGKTLSLGARRITAEINASRIELRARIAGRSGQVAISATPSPCVYWLPQLMRKFSDQYPGITLRLHDAVSENCLGRLQRGAADFAVVAQAGDRQQFDSIPLFDEKFYLLCRWDDPLAKISCLRLSQLRDCTYIQVAGSGYIWEQRKRDLHAAGVCDSGLEVTNFGTLVGLIVAGFGVGLVPSMALPLCQRQELIALRIQEETFVRTFFLVRRRNRSLSLASAHLVNFLLAASERGKDQAGTVR